jgi:hypothetical protein
LNSKLYDIKGFFLPIAGGGPIVTSSSFGTFFESAYEEGEIEALKLPIYPYLVNSLHYFATSGNPEAITYCFANEVKYLKDAFGKTPLDYALESKDKSALNAVVTGILNLDQGDRIKVL